MQIVRGIYQVGGDQSGLTWAGVDAGFEDGNTFVLDTGQGLILFDAGCGDTHDQILANLAHWGLDPAQLRHCLLTHAHFDHAAGAHRWQAAGVELIAHRLTAEAVATGDERCCGYLYHKRFPPCEVDRIVEEGDTITLCGVDIAVMHLPGHSMGCTAYLFTHAGRRVVVSGDVIGTLNVGDFGWSGSIDFDKTRYLQSLQRFARVDTDLMLPGHGPAYHHQPRRRVEQALNSALMQWR
jgi:glyoxylase-like metal-dependent hydrolase (beta-lactamase superfamily II)